MRFEPARASSAACWSVATGDDEVPAFASLPRDDTKTPSPSPSAHGLVAGLPPGSQPDGPDPSTPLSARAAPSPGEGPGPASPPPSASAPPAGRSASPSYDEKMEHAALAAAPSTHTARTRPRSLAGLCLCTGAE